MIKNNEYVKHSNWSTYFFSHVCSVDLCILDCHHDRMRQKEVMLHASNHFVVCCLSLFIFYKHQFKSLLLTIVVYNLRYRGRDMIIPLSKKTIVVYCNHILSYSLMILPSTQCIPQHVADKMVVLESF